MRGLAGRAEIVQQLAECRLHDGERRQAFFTTQAPADGPENKQRLVRRSYPVPATPQPQRTKSLAQFMRGGGPSRSPR